MSVCLCVSIIYIHIYTNMYMKYIIYKYIYIYTDDIFKLIYKRALFNWLKKNKL